MKRNKPLINARGEVRELTAADLGHGVPFSGLPSGLRKTLLKRGPQKAPKKLQLSIRLAPEIVLAFRATGPGWQSRINDTLAAHVRAGKVRT